MRSRRWGIAKALTAGLLMFFGAAMASMASLSTHPVASPPQGDENSRSGGILLGVGPPGPGPLAAGHSVSLDEAESQAPFRVLRPNHPLANDQNLDDVWLRLAWDPEVALEYSSGIRIYVRKVPFDDPDQFYEDMIKTGVPGHRELVGNVNAFLVPPEKTGGQPGSIDLVMGDIEVSIIERGDVSSQQLLEIAETVS